MKKLLLIALLGATIGTTWSAAPENEKAAAEFKFLTKRKITRDRAIRQINTILNLAIKYNADALANYMSMYDQIKPMSVALYTDLQADLNAALYQKNYAIAGMYAATLMAFDANRKFSPQTLVSATIPLLQYYGFPLDRLPSDILELRNKELPLEYTVEQ